MLHWPVQQVIRDVNFLLTGRELADLLSRPQLWLTLLSTMGFVILLSHFTYRNIEQPLRRQMRSSPAIRRILRV
jgi:peptidoglycan/LPS O-acetylase OafA/YrhL